MIETMGTYAFDKAVEEAVSRFLDSRFYPHMPFDNVRRVSGMEEQKRGMDVTARMSGKEVIIDEKCCSHYVNKSIPTFAFELSFLGRDGNARDGWFIDGENLTTHYLLLWPYADTTPSDTWESFTEDDITKVEYALIPKDSILRYLDSMGFDRDRLSSATEYIRTCGDDTLSTITGNMKKNRDFWFSRSYQLDERPINLIIRKERLLSLSTHHGTVTHNQGETGIVIMEKEPTGLF